MTRSAVKHIKNCIINKKRKKKDLAVPPNLFIFLFQVLSPGTPEFDTKSLKTS